MLGVSTAAQAGSAVMIHGPAFLIPALHRDHGLTLAGAGLVAAAPIAGVMVALVAWGAVVDRLGERFVLLAGLIATAIAGMVATRTTDPVPLGLALLAAGAAAASTSSASGRVVVGWFPPRRRGLAMGIRHMSQPAGVGLAAVTMAVLALDHGIAAALWVPTAAALVSIGAVALTVVDPPRPERTVVTGANPYRAEPRVLGYLSRIHLVSVLLVVPQFLVWTFALVWLVDQRGWHPGAAGTLVGLAQLTGVLARVAAGWVSDRVGSRMRPLRAVALTAGAVMALLALTDALTSPLAVLLLVAATGITVADNGLAFTAVAERAGPFWSGRALGAQNTAQYLAAAAVPPVAGLAITHLGYAATFALAAALPLLAAPLVPVGEEHPLS